MGVAGEPIDEEQAVLAQLISYLASQTQEEQHDALFTVAGEMVIYAYGDDGARIGEMMRSQGGLTQLTWILSDPQQPLDVQQVLLLLGNLCSDSVDPASMLSKRYLLNMGVERRALQLPPERRHADTHLHLRGGAELVSRY